MLIMMGGYSGSCGGVCCSDGGGPSPVCNLIV